MRVKAFYFFFSIFLLFNDQVFAHTNPWNNIDSLKRVLAKNDLSGKERIDTRNLLAWGYLQEKPDSSLLLSQQLAEQAGKLNYNQGLGDAWVNIGRYHKNRGALPEAMQALLKALKYYEQAGNQLQVAYTYTDIAAVHYRNKNMDQCLATQEKALKAFKKANDKQGIAYAYTNLANVYYSRGNDSLVVKYDSLSLEIKKEIGNVIDIASSLINIGIYWSEKNPEKAVSYLEEGLTYCKSGSYYEGTMRCYQNLGKLSASKGNYVQANAYLDSAIVLGEKYQMGLMRVSLIQSKINILEKQQRFKSANQLYRTMVKLKDSLLNAENSRQIAEMQTRFETEKKQQQIEALELKNENEALTRRIYGIALILLLAISTLLAGWMRYRNKKQEELRLQEKKLADEKLQRAMDQLESYTKQLIERTHREARLQQDLERLKSELESQSPDSDENIESLMESTLLTEDEWHSFKKLFQQVYPGFFVSLRKNYPDLTATEERLLALTRLSLQNREVARMLGISVDSVKKSKYRLRKKLHMNTDQLQEMVEEL